MKSAWRVAALSVVVGGCPSVDPSVDPAEGEGEAGEGEGEGEGEPRGDVVDNDFGFEMRTTVSHELPCEEDEFSCPTGSFTAQEIAYVCTLNAVGDVNGDGVTDGADDGVVYVHARPTAINAGGFPFAVYDDVDGFFAADGVVVAVDATYDFGGNHHNDTIGVAVDGAIVTFDHSSYGFGFRACHPPDCLKIEGDDGSFVDGCNPERTRPVACIAVVDPLPPLVDNFATCAGDDG